jgi:hypothetical protein
MSTWNNNWKAQNSHQHPPFPAFDAIAETIVKIVAKLKLPKIVAIRYMSTSVAGWERKYQSA